MVSLTALLSESTERLDRMLPLAAVPLVVSLLAVGKFRRVAAFDGVHVGVRFVIPSPVSGLWSFVSLPNAESAGALAPSATTPLTVASLVGGAVVAGVLAAGYLGSLRRELSDESRTFIADVRRHLAPMLGYHLLVAAVGLTLVGTGAAAGPLVFFLLPVLLLLGYLFYATPYLVVTGDRSLRAALAASYGYATPPSGDYLGFFLRYLGAGALVSAPTTLFVVNLGVGGAALAAVLFAPVGLVFDTATMAFVRRLDDEGTDGPPYPAVRRVAP